jgi:hypothetical protein
MTKIDQKILDEIAQKEVEALLKNLQDPEMIRNPSFLEKVRKFLKDNKLDISPETPGVKTIQRKAEELPVFEDEEGVLN